MFVCCDCCVLSGRGLCDEPITRPEESYRLWCVVVCDLQNLKDEEAMTRVGSKRHQKKRVVYDRISTKHCWDDADSRTAKHSRRKLSQCHFFYHKSHTDRSGIKTMPPPWEANEHPPGTCNGMIWLVKIILINYDFHNFCLLTNIFRCLRIDGVWDINVGLTRVRENKY